MRTLYLYDIIGNVYEFKNYKNMWFEERTDRVFMIVKDENNNVTVFNMDVIIYYMEEVGVKRVK